MTDELGRKLERLARLSDATSLPSASMLRRQSENRRRRARFLKAIAIALVIAAIAVPLVIVGPGSSSNRTTSSPGGPKSVVATYVPTSPGLSAQGLATDVRIMTTRLAALGHGGAVAEVRGNSIAVVSTTKLSPSLLRVVAADGVLQFRPVLCFAGPYVPTTPQPSNTFDGCSSARYELNSSNLNVNVETGTPTNTPPTDPGLAQFPSSTPAFNDSNPDQDVLVPAIPGSGASGTRLLLGPAGVSNSAVQSAEAVFSNPQWIVDIDLTSSGSVLWDQLAQEQFHAYIGVDQDGAVISAPLILPTQSTFVSFGGRIQISANFTQASARGLASLINSGSLPISLEERELTSS